MKWNAVAIFAASLGLSFGVTTGVIKEVKQQRDDKVKREKTENEDRKYNIESDTARNDFCKKYSNILNAIAKRRFRVYGQLLEDDKKILSAVNSIPSNGNEHTEKIKRSICYMLNMEILECEIRLDVARRDGEIKPDNLSGLFFGYNVFSDLKVDLFGD